MSAYISDSASAWDASDQFDALCRTLFAPFGLLRLVKADHDGGRMDWAYALVLGPDGSFGSFRGDAIQAQRPPHINPPVDDSVILTWMRKGRIVQEAPCGTQTEVLVGGLNVYDTADSMRFHRSAMRGLNLVLPRRSVLSALGGHAPESRSLPLQATPLAPFLFAQLDLLDRLGASLPPPSRQAALDASVQLALSCLREAHQLSPHLLECNHSNQGLLAAARQYMHLNLHEHGLDVERIAHAVHSSRATLYRAFAEQNTSIIAELREMRLQAARHLLESSQEPVGALAWRCGFASAATFSRAFRTRFGCSAQDWRAQNRHS